MNTAVMMSSAQQDWRTPKGLFDAVSALAGGFDLDAAADANNALVEDYMGLDHATDSAYYDALEQPWGAPWDEGFPVTVWLNPPYGPALAKFAAKAVEVWMLVPARVDTRWWNLLMSRAVEVRFMAGRVKFERPDGARDSAPFPSAIVRLRHDGGDPKVFWGWRP